VVRGIWGRVFWTAGDGAAARTVKLGDLGFRKGTKNYSERVNLTLLQDGITRLEERGEALEAVSLEVVTLSHFAQ
jgi:hypothetical protein